VKRSNPHWSLDFKTVEPKICSLENLECSTVRKPTKEWQSGPGAVQNRPLSLS
jgi:hypothetical protein